MFGLIPWRAFDFRPFFFETAGLNKIQSATVNSSGGFAAAAGSAFGGWMGDTLNRCWPLHGRVLAAEIAVYGGIPIAFLTFTFTPDASWAFGYYFALTVGLGLIATWTPAACNSPVLSSLASPNERALILSWQVSLEGAVGAAGGILFTYLIEWFGYDPSCNDPCTAGASCAGKDNKAIAGRALVWTSCVPWLLCGALYSSLHCTYPRDLADLEAERLAKGGMDPLTAERLAAGTTELATSS